VAKAFVRISKSQDIISVATTNPAPSITTARYSAAQPQTAEARMDCRTPGAAIVYRYQSAVTNVTGRNWGDINNPDNNDVPGAPFDSLTTGNPDENALGNPRTGTPITGTPTDASTPANSANQYGGKITLPIGNVATYQGYQWLVRAVGRTGTGTNNDPYAYSVYSSEEIAYRTVLTYQINNMGNTGNYGSRLNEGEQVWIRGGDAIGSSTVPGYPLTWADEWGSLSGKRAGIKLLTKTTDGNLYNATWKWVSWEINVPAYFDVIRGINASNTANDAAVAWQYGPTQWSYQRDGWTSYKDQYPMFPGKHRWLYVNAAQSFGPKGSVNFSTTWAQRQTFTETKGWGDPTTANTANPTPQ
jgi:hypothetical protein